MPEITIAKLGGATPLMMQQATQSTPGEVRTAVRQAVEDAMRGSREGVQNARAANVAGTAAAQATIDALQGQIVAERITIDALTKQLTGGTSKAAERAITEQIEQSQERLSSLQTQMDQALGVRVAAPELAMPQFPPGDIIPQQAVEITQMFFVTIAVVAIGIPLARAFGRWMDRRGHVQPAAAPVNIDPRLDRIEQAIEAVAIEVERISEGQRFTNKLMNEARALPAPNPLEQWPRSGAKEPVPAERKGER